MLKLQVYHSALLRISKLRITDSASLDKSYIEICDILAESLNIARSSVWFYDERKTAIICKNLFEKEKKTHTSGLILKAVDFPKYFEYLKESRTLPAHDACTDPATAEFKDVYLKPLGISSMLDSPIRINGEVLGVVCNEHIGPMRQWTSEEELFAGVVADHVAMLVETYHSIQTEKQVEAEKLIAMRHAKLASIGEMAGGIAHEINNPLQVILARAEKISNLMQEDQLDKKAVTESITSIIKTADRITRIVRGLRVLARDGSRDTMEEFDLLPVIEDSTSYCKEKMRQNGIELETVVSPNPIPVVGNSVGLSQVLVNLLNNAFDAVRDHAERWVRVEVKQDPERLKIVVTDSGPGIPEAIRSKLMQPFFTTKPPGKGTGLGLSLSRDIISSHGGTLTIDTKSKNTSFVVDLPTKKAA